MRTPWQYAETGSEHSSQVALFMWAAMARKFGLTAANDPNCYIAAKNISKYKCDDCVPQLKWLHAVANHGSGYGRAAEGVRAGVSDIFLPVPMRIDYDLFYHGLYIEMKAPGNTKRKPGIVSVAQSEFQFDMREAGYMAYICYSWIEARDAILKYLGLTA